MSVKVSEVGQAAASVQEDVACDLEIQTTACNRRSNAYKALNRAQNNCPQELVQWCRAELQKIDCHISGARYQQAIDSCNEVQAQLSNYLASSEAVSVDRKIRRGKKSKAKLATRRHSWTFVPQMTAAR